MKVAVVVEKEERRQIMLLVECGLRRSIDVQCSVEWSAGQWGGEGNDEKVQWTTG